MQYLSHQSYISIENEWIHQIPSHWQFIRLKFVCHVNPTKSEARYFPQDTEVSFLPMELIGEDGTLSLTEIRTIDSVFNGFTYFRDGDVIVAKITPCFENGKGALARNLVNSLGFGTTELHVLRPLNNISPKFIYYITHSELFRETGSALMVGAAGQKRVPLEFVADFEIGLPPLSEQQSIADFLDQKIAVIDTLIAKKRELIERLQEKRTALISRAVTKGLDPSVPMKDSGVEWLGEIPAQWEAKRLIWVAKLETGHTPRRSVDAYWENCTIPWVSLNDTKYLAQNDYISETAIKISELGMNNSSAHLIPAPAVIFTRDATIGLTAITTKPMAVSQHIIAWLCGEEIIPEYLLQVFDAMHGELERLTMGSTLKTIGMPDVKSLSTPLPPIEEQREIISFINYERQVINDLVSKIQEAIGRLQEYRTALISATVTGKIDVRG